MSKQVYWLALFFLLGIFFRLWLITLVPQPLYIGDQYDYHLFAVAIAQKGLFAESARLYGYPLFLALLYKIFGIGNTSAFIAQAILDVATAVIIFLIGKKIFKRETLAWIAFSLYLINPFTSNFVGLLTTEILAIFLVALISYLILLFGFTKALIPPVSLAHTISHYTLLFLLALLLGYLPQVRPPFLFYTLVMMIGILLIVYKYLILPVKSKILIGLLACFFYILPFSYNVIGNVVYFGKANPLTVDNIFVRELYISLFVGRSPAHDKTLILDPPLYMFPPQVKAIYEEFTLVPKTTQERKAMAQKYFDLAIREIKKDPGEFVISHLKKMWYVWEKHFIFYYYQPENKLVDFATYWGNVLLLGLGVVGMLYWLVRQALANQDPAYTWFAASTLFLFIYISVLHSFSLSEERYSLPAYPLIFLFAAFSITRLMFKADSHNRRN